MSTKDEPPMNDLAVASLDTQHAQLPALYEQAKSSLASAERIDECKEWSDKAAALASYAKQAGDQELSDYAARIRARAFRRMSDLLETFQNARARTDLTPEAVTQRSIAEANGITRKQEETIRNVGKIPEDTFNELLHGDSPPPTVTQLAEYGRTGKIAPKQYNLATDVLSFFHPLLTRIKRHSPEQFCEGVATREVLVLIDDIDDVVFWPTRAEGSCRGDIYVYHSIQTSVPFCR